MQNAFLTIIAAVALLVVSMLEGARWTTLAWKYDSFKCVPSSRMHPEVLHNGGQGTCWTLGLRPCDLSFQLSPI